MSNNHPTMLCIYRRRKNIMVDVLEFNGAAVEKNSIWLYLSEPKLDKTLDLLEWMKEFQLREKDLIWYTPLDESLHGDEIKAYQNAVKSGLEIARLINKGKQPSYPSGEVWKARGRRRKKHRTHPITGAHWF